MPTSAKTTSNIKHQMQTLAVCIPIGHAASGLQTERAFNKILFLKVKVW